MRTGNWLVVVQLGGQNTLQLKSGSLGLIPVTVAFFIFLCFHFIPSNMCLGMPTAVVSV